MSQDRSPNRHLIVMHVVCVSLTPLIPIPFADDYVATGFRRRLVRKLAEAHKLELLDKGVRRLADRAGTSFFGHVGNVITYPVRVIVRKIFRKIFYVLEWKRALDLLGEDTLRAALLEHALTRGLCEPAGAYSCEKLAAAIDRTVLVADRGLFHRAARAALKQSKTLVMSAVGLLARALLARGKSAPAAPVTPAAPAAPAAPEQAADQAEQTLDGLEQKGPSAIDQLADLLERIVDSLPADYLPKLAERLEMELATGELDERGRAGASGSERGPGRGPG